MLSGLTVKAKLFVLLIGSVIGFSIISFCMYKFVWTAHHYGEIETEIAIIKSDMLMLRRDEKDFMLRKELKYKVKYEKNYDQIITDSKILIQLLQDNNIEYQQVTIFINILKKYKIDMLRYISLQEKIGLNEKLGLYKSLRHSVHNVQDTAKKAKDYELLALVYNLRKQEKDFMLRRNFKYVDKYIVHIDKLLSNHTLMKPTIKQSLLDYKKDFINLANAEKELGLTYKDGLKGKLRATINKTESVLENLSTSTSTIVKAKINDLIYYTMLLSIVLIISTTIVILLINKNIAKSLNNFQDGLLDFFLYLNKKTQSVHKLDTSSKDEFGSMAIIVNENINTITQLIKEDASLIDEVKEIVLQVNNGYLKHTISKSTSNKSLEELKNLLNNMLNTLSTNICTDLNKLQSALQNYQKLDFTHRIDNDTGKTAQGLNALANIINEMLVENKANGLTLEKSSSTLLYNVESLSSSSNQAAASLEETAAALEEITSNISNTTNNVVNMASHAKDVTTSVNEGQILASKTTTAMDEINIEVNSIHEAITVIDQISFQTNILSLNAAVEAATAGEAGKGFAVVAQEVRNLASRSADAANEIKALVEKATNKANNGKNIADDMIHGYTSLNESISKTLDLIHHVENASKEQFKGIEQINHAVTELDQQTQQNASVASNTRNVALQTQTIAQAIVNNANEKEFIGKEEVKAKISTN